ncbi:aminotransferase class III-fold pyridoxal phosphate-dependent enzyme [Reichenbachiella agarivorans]|uniref:Aminotransferase class III-fold pyridoxal phosphate-dependent enzyme n=1 Tax=Reichenbachiella agarivorans TaxID=2979464 RepID=A0ABY6CLD2_9BACT|nr:aminotransferase class III-fold pyridoxal phosphate-dependent enzyme [Reichenbachiella agarivorans]UXP31329.1 aminotransferase class III-fold pyridoxal phosphate-dependent enzyme [Reichenbachiella agarivorans]
MKNYKVYPLFDITIEKGEGNYVYDTAGERYLDFYGGHAVISIGHSHPTYVTSITEQVNKIGFYSNSVQIPQQEELAEKLGVLSGYEDYDLFLCNSGAEANENALKLASFQNGRNKIVAFKNGFHGRTSLAVAATDNPKIQAAVNATDNIQLFELGDLEGVKAALATKEVACVIIEGIQGVGGINDPGAAFLEGLQKACKETGTIFILDEVQSGYGRTGKFFAHQYADVKPDLITIAKGMGNGFPIGGVIISPDFEASFGQLGTTFGGNHLACAAGLAVLDVMKAENLMNNSQQIGDYIISQLKDIKSIKEIRGKGLLLGLEFEDSVKELRGELLKKYKIFTGAATNPKVLRLLPPMTITKTEADIFINALTDLL